MEFFRDVHSVRLLGHKGKYLWADDDRRSVAQKKGQDSYGVIWRVELVPERNTIRLKSVYDLYLLASDYPFLLGATGKKVMQSFLLADNSPLEWEPMAAGTFVKLRTKGDKFLRANGGVPPYRNSVTHDTPVLTSNQHVVLWEVEVVRKKDPASLQSSRQPSPKQAPVVRPQSPPPRRPQVDPNYDPESSVPPPIYVPRPRPQRRHSAPTEIDFPVPNEDSSSPSERLSPIASPPRRRRSPPPSQSIDSTPPRRHRVPVPSQSLKNPPKDEYDSSFSESPSPVHQPAPQRHRATVSEVPTRFTANDDYDSSPSEASPPISRVSNLRIDEAPSPRTPRVKSPSDVRRIFYTVAEDDGEVLAHDDETFGSFLFAGHSLQELTEQLQLETGIDEDIILCMRNPLTTKLYKMRLQLPPNKAPLSVVVVRHNSQFGRTFSIPSVHKK